MFLRLIHFIFYVYPGLSNVHCNLVRHKNLIKVYRCNDCLLCGGKKRLFVTYYHTTITNSLFTVLNINSFECAETHIHTHIYCRFNRSTTIVREDCRKLMGDSWRRSDIVQEISFGYCVKRFWEIKLESDRWYSLYVCIDTLGLIFDIPEIYWNFLGYWNIHVLKLNY